MKTVEESKYAKEAGELFMEGYNCCLLYTSPSPRD